MKSRIKIPQCCGADMAVRIETPNYVEVACKKCGDTVYVKKAKLPKPQMLDD